MLGTVVKEIDCDDKNTLFNKEKEEECLHNLMLVVAVWVVVWVEVVKSHHKLFERLLNLVQMLTYLMKLVYQNHMAILHPLNHLKVVLICVTFVNLKGKKLKY